MPCRLEATNFNERGLHSFNEPSGFPLAEARSSDRTARRNTTKTPDIEERSLTPLQGIRQFPTAVRWSVVISSTLIMEGYSTILVPNLFAVESFKQNFGRRQSNGSYEISAAWQSGLVNGSIATQIMGLFIAGALSEAIGYRRTLMVGLVAMAAFISVQFYAPTKGVLLLGQCLLGLPCGLFQCIATVYAADVSPIGLRAYLTTFVNACWVLGQLIAASVLRGTMSQQSPLSYRLPLGLQWIFPIPIFIAVAFAPDSCWWLVRRDCLQEAKHNLRRVRTQGEKESPADFERRLDATIEEIFNTNAKERIAQSRNRYIDCFKGTDRRRTEISCMTWVIQAFCGSTLMAFSTYFYRQVGLVSSHAFALSVGQFSLGLVGVGVSWVLMQYAGRRILYTIGQVAALILVLLIGVVACLPSRTARATTATQWAIAVLLVLFTLTYDATVGPICYTIVSEVPSTRSRVKTLVLARSSYNIASIVANIVTPSMLNPTAWNWGGKAGFVWAGMALFGVVWSWWRLPETKGRMFGELDELFERGVDARKFGKATVSRIRGWWEV